MDINNGRLNTSEDYKIIDTDGSLSSGKLVMDNNNDYICVGRDFEAYNGSVNYDPAYLSAGTIEIKGDFKIDDTTNFILSGTKF